MLSRWMASSHSSSRALHVRHPTPHIMVPTVNKNSLCLVLCYLRRRAILRICDEFDDITIPKCFKSCFSGMNMFGMVLNIKPLLFCESIQTLGKSQHVNGYLYSRVLSQISCSLASSISRRYDSRKRQQLFVSSVLHPTDA